MRNHKQRHFLSAIQAGHTGDAQPRRADVRISRVTVTTQHSMSQADAHLLGRLIGESIARARLSPGSASTIAVHVTSPVGGRPAEMAHAVGDALSRVCDAAHPEAVR